ncbi:GMC family oxidoreductase [Paenibacillus flagellatus]|uniref:GMC family oxidoreductase n=1 Tax=Paenibacillus flagellatus TaxID=2211139 RepID=UPI00319DDD84
MGIEIETSRLVEASLADPDQPVVLGAFAKQHGPGRRLQLIGLPAPFFVPVQEVSINNWQFDPEKSTNVFSIGIFDLNPKSRGTILATHSDPQSNPTVQIHALADPDDLNYLVDQYIETYNIITRARQMDPDGVYKVVYPPEPIFQMTDEEAKRERLASYVIASYGNTFHFGGTCRMAKSKRDGVVDGYLNVFGTKRLKVADLSIAPVLPDGNTSIPSQMIGLNAARFIREGRH